MVAPKQQGDPTLSEDHTYVNAGDVQAMSGKRRRQCCTHPVLIGVLLCVALLVGIAGGYLAAYYLGYHASRGKRLKALQLHGVHKTVLFMPFGLEVSNFTN